MDFKAEADFASSLDKKDSLSAFRSQFSIPRTSQGKEEIYFCGNSLGLRPHKAKDYVLQEVEDWAAMGVKGHFKPHTGWKPYHELVTKNLAEVVGALETEAVAMNALTVNLHLMMTSFYRPTSERFKVLIEKAAFPSDRYAVESQIRLHGFDPEQALLELAPREGEFYLRMEDLEETIRKDGASIALILWPGVQYYTGQAFDLARITELGHSQGCRVGFDLAHAAGNLHLRLHDSNADFAAWCSYKYLNSGPGAIGGCFVHERHHRNSEILRLAGWWGHNKTTRFQMGSSFDPIPSIEAWQISNPPIFSLAPLRASLEIFHEAKIENLRAKSEKLTAYLEFLIQKELKYKVQILTPADPKQRGCQLSMQVKGGKKAHEKLIEAGVVCDWREPDVIRMAPAPLYNTFSEVYRAVEVLKTV